jgi:Rab5 GDP/GTP exchange factor
MGAVQFVENMDRTTLTITDDEFEKNVEAAVSAIAEKHQANSPLISQQPTFDEKTGASRPSLDGQDHGNAGDDTLPIGGLLKTIQKPLSTIGRIFSDDGGQASASSSSASPSQPPPQNRHRRSHDGGTADGSHDGGQRPSSKHALSAEEAAARQASAEAAEAQRLHRAEHANVVETLSGMFPDLDKDIISDVVHQKQGR